MPKESSHHCGPCAGLHGLILFVTALVPLVTEHNTLMFLYSVRISEPEPLSLNRSININYSNPKTKKKVKTNRYSVSVLLYNALSFIPKMYLTLSQTISSKLKESADNIIEFDESGRIFSKRVENTGKRRTRSP